MKTLRLKYRDSIRWPDDVSVIVRVMEAAGYRIDPKTASDAWNEWCAETHCSPFHEPDGYSDAEIVEAVLSQCEVVEGGDA